MTYKTICSKCGLLLKGNANAEKITHSYCRKCADKLIAKLSHENVK